MGLHLSMQEAKVTENKLNNANNNYWLLVLAI